MLDTSISVRLMPSIKGGDNFTTHNTRVMELPPGQRWTHPWSGEAAHQTPKKRNKIDLPDERNRENAGLEDPGAPTPTPGASSSQQSPAPHTLGAGTTTLAERHPSPRPSRNHPTHNPPGTCSTAPATQSPTPPTPPAENFSPPPLSNCWSSTTPNTSPAVPPSKKITPATAVHVPLAQHVEQALGAANIPHYLSI